MTQFKSCPWDNRDLSRRVPIDFNPGEKITHRQESTHCRKLLFDVLPFTENCFSISFIHGDFLPLSAELQALFPAFCRLFGALASSAVFDAKTRHMR
jgi:hypothetical protein